jgi:hypothetical protein
MADEPTSDEITQDRIAFVRAGGRLILGYDPRRSAADREGRGPDQMIVVDANDGGAWLITLALPQTPEDVAPLPDRAFGVTAVTPFESPARRVGRR